jgi:hypothetical protein
MFRILSQILIDRQATIDIPKALYPIGNLVSVLLVIIIQSTGSESAAEIVRATRTTRNQERIRRKSAIRDGPFGLGRDPPRSSRVEARGDRQSGVWLEGSQSGDGT